ncbi:DUF429 domain-containing protein [Cryptosporangium arvum]|uniref:DUF429 domain-containing protein n=1 Tax=Cryptosporangium arvum DSM 44712 TaxID=927661 RepID=A0A010YJA7_9ACTN|nr:DUF429 domain-containing protein [Cryptosporangium arvum]EXG80290.1 Protein of unknown function (DUF429) [Cryptosporangium arvum DSM 44712]
MRTLGVDLAAEAATTALATIDWAPSGARVHHVQVSITDDVLVDAVRGATRTGIDCPLGWPTEFVRFLVAWSAGTFEPPVRTDKAWRRRLAYRRTDEVVRERLGLVPLSVAADRIAHPALRCAGILARLAADGVRVDRVVVEAYPAGSLKCWGLPHRRYKGTANAPARHALVDELLARAPWLDLGPHEPLCRASDHALDAVLAGLTARAAALGLTHPPLPEDAAAAAKEGWIALPTGPLDELDPITS